VGAPAKTLNVVAADAGYSNGESSRGFARQKGNLAACTCQPRCEQSRLMARCVRPHENLPISRERHVLVSGRSELWLAKQLLAERSCGVLDMGVNRKCGGSCALKIADARPVPSALISHGTCTKRRFSACNSGPRQKRWRLRRSTVEHPFANLKYRIFGHPRFLLRGLRGAQTENQAWR